MVYQLFRVVHRLWKSIRLGRKLKRHPQLYQQPSFLFSAASQVLEDAALCRHRQVFSMGSIHCWLNQSWDRSAFPWSMLAIHLINALRVMSHARCVCSAETKKTSTWAHQHTDHGQVKLQSSSDFIQTRIFKSRRNRQLSANKAAKFVMLVCWGVLVCKNCKMSPRQVTFRITGQLLFLLLSV